MFENKEPNAPVAVCEPAGLETGVPTVLQADSSCFISIEDKAVPRKEKLVLSGFYEKTLEGMKSVLRRVKEACMKAYLFVRRVLVGEEREVSAV